MYFFKVTEEGGGALMHVNDVEHIFSFTAEPLDGCLRNLVWIKNLWSLTCVRRFCQGRIQGGAKIGQGSPLQKYSSSDWKATTTNRMQSNDLEACRKGAAMVEWLSSWLAEQEVWGSILGLAT